MLTSFVIREMKIKIIRYHYPTSRKAKIKGQLENVGEATEQLGHSHIAGWEYKWHNYFRN